MKVRFPVFGATVDELENEAKRILEAFGPDKRWVHSIEATTELMTGAGVIELWRGEVEGECPT